MFLRSQRPEPDAIEVVLGQRATFSGALQCDASIRIDGAVEQGKITTPANVIITETGNVHCDIVARTVSIRGRFNGIIQADRVEMLDGSQVQGVLNVKSLYTDENAVLRAAVNIRADVAADIRPPQPPAQPFLPIVQAQETTGPQPAVGDSPSPVQSPVQ